MFSKIKKMSMSRENGQALVMVALLLTTLVLILAMVIDFGIAYHKKSTFQTALDSASLAVVDSFGDINLETTTDGFLKVSYSQSNMLKDEIIKYMGDNGFEVTRDDVDIYTKQSAYDNAANNLETNQILLLVKQKDPDSEEASTITGYKYAEMIGSYEGTFQFPGLLGSDVYDTCCKSTAKANLTLSGNPDALRYQILAFGGDDSSFSITGPVEDTFIKTGLNIIQGAINGLMDFCQNDTYLISALMGGSTEYTCPSCGYIGSGTEFDADQDGNYYCPNCDTQCNSDDSNAVGCNITTSAAIMNGFVHSNGSITIKSDTFRMRSYIDGFVKGESDDVSSDQVILSHMPVLSLATDETNLHMETRNSSGKGIYLADLLTTPEVNANGDTVYTKAHYEESEEAAKYYDANGVELSGSSSDSDYFQDRVYPLTTQLWYNQDIVSDPGLISYISDRIAQLPSSPNISQSTDASKVINKLTNTSKDYKVNSIVYQNAGSSDSPNKYSVIFDDNLSYDDTETANVTTTQKGILNFKGEDTEAQKINPKSLLERIALTNEDANSDNEADSVLPNVFETYDKSFSFKTGENSVTNTEKGYTLNAKTSFSVENITDRTYNVQDIVDTYANVNSNTHAYTGTTTESDTTRQKVHDALLSILTSDEHTMEGVDSSDRDAMREALPISDDIQVAISTRMAGASSKASTALVNADGNKSYTTPGITKAQIINIVHSKKDATKTATYFDVTDYSVKAASDYLPTSTSGYTNGGNIGGKYSNTDAYYLGNNYYYGYISSPYYHYWYGFDAFKSVAVGSNTTSYVTGNAEISTDQEHGFDIQAGSTLYIGGNFTAKGGSGVYIHIADNATVIVGGNLASTGEVTLGTNAKLIVAGSVTVNGGARLTLGANATVDAGGFVDFSYLTSDVSATISTNSYVNCGRTDAGCDFGKLNCMYITANAALSFNGITNVKGYISNNASTITVNSEVAVGSNISTTNKITINGRLSVNGKDSSNNSITCSVLSCSGTLYCAESFVFSSSDTSTSVSGTAYFGGNVSGSQHFDITTDTANVYCSGNYAVGLIYIANAAQLYCESTVTCSGDVSIIDNGKLYCKGAFTSSGRIELSLNSTADLTMTAGLYAESVTTSYLILQGSSQLFSNGDLNITTSGDGGGILTKDNGPNSSSCPNLWVGGNINAYSGTNRFTINLSSYANVNCGGKITCGAMTCYNNYINTGSVDCSSAILYYTSLWYNGSFVDSGSFEIHGESSKYSNLIGIGNISSTSFTVDTHSFVSISGSVNTGAIIIGQAGKDTEEISGTVCNGFLYCTNYVNATSVHTYGYLYVAGLTKNANGNALELTGDLICDTGPVDPVTEEKSGSKTFVDGNCVSGSIKFYKMASLFCSGNATTTGVGAEGSESIYFDGKEVDSVITSSTIGVFLCGGNITSAGSIAVWSASEYNFSYMYASGDIRVADGGYVYLSDYSISYASNYYLGIHNEEHDSTVYGILYADYNIYALDANTRTMNILVADTGTVGCANSSEIPITYSDGKIYLNGELQEDGYNVSDFSVHKIRFTVGRLKSSNTSKGYHVTGHETGSIFAKAQDVVIDKGGILEISGTVTITGNVTVYGDLICGKLVVLGNSCVSVQGGAIQCSGDIELQATTDIWGNTGTYMVNCGSIYSGGHLEVKGAGADYMGLQNGSYATKASGYLYVHDYLAVKNATVNHRGEIYVGNYFRTAYSHGCNSGPYFGNGYNGSDNSAVFVQNDFVCTPSDGEADIIARKNAMVYCGGSLQTDRCLIAGNAWVSQSGATVENGYPSEEAPAQYKYYYNYDRVQLNNTDAEQGFNNVDNKIYYTAADDQFALNVYKVVAADTTPGAGEKTITEIWPSYRGGIAKPESLINTYVKQKTYKSSENTSDFGFIYVEGTAKTGDNYYTETKGKSVIYVNGTDTTGSSDYACYNSNYAIQTHHFAVFPYSRIYAGGNVRASGGNSSNIALNQWFNSMFYVDGNLDLNNQTKIRDGAKLVVSGNIWSNNLMEIGKAADGVDEAEDDYLTTYVQAGGTISNSNGYIKLYARTTVIANGDFTSTNYLTLRHGCTLKANGRIRSTLSSIDIGSCSNVYANGNLESILSTVKIRDNCKAYINGDIISLSYLEIGKHEDEEYKYADKPSDNDIIEEGTVIETPDGDAGGSSSDDSTIDTSDMQCPYCGSKSITATATEGGEGETKYACSNCGKDLTNNTEFFEDDSAWGSIIYVTGTLKARTSYLRLYANTQAFVGDKVNVYSYLTLRHNAGLYVPEETSDYTGLEYSYDKSTGALKDINGDTVSGFYVNIDPNSDEYGSIYYKQDGIDYYGFNIKKASDSTDSNGDSIIDRWLYQDELYYYVDGEKFYGANHEADYDLNGETITEEYTDCLYYTDDGGVISTSGISEANSIPTSMVGSAITVDGATKVFGYDAAEHSIFVLGDLTVNSGARLYASGSISSYGQTKVGNKATMYALGDINISCWLSISSLISDGSPYGFVLNHGSVYAGRDISINATCDIEGGTVMAGDDVTFDSIYTFYSYNNTYNAGTAAYEEMAKNIDLIVAAQGRNYCPYCLSDDVNADYDGGTTCKCLYCGKEFTHDYGNINYDCIYYVGGGLSYAPNGNITSEGIYYNYYGNMMADTIDINAYYTNFHRLANWRTIDIQTERTGDVYLVDRDEADES